MVRRLALSALVVSLLFLAPGLVIGVWLAVQRWTIGFAWPIRFVAAGNGVAIVALALPPAVRRSLAPQA